MANDLDRIRRLAVDGIDTANHEYGTGELRELAELAVSLCSEVERLRAENAELAAFKDGASFAIELEKRACDIATVTGQSVETVVDQVLTVMCAREAQCSGNQPG